MKNKRVKTKAMALAICMVMAVSILAAFVLPISAMESTNVDRPQIAQSATNPVPFPNAAFMPIEPMKAPENLEEFKEMMEERREQRFQEQQMKERKVVQGTYFDITGNFAILWKESEDVDSTWAWIAGDLDGDGSDDVLVNMYEYDDITGATTSTLIAKSGIDGTHLWKESVSVSNGWCEIWAMPAGDLDGDGSDDVLVQIYKSDYATDSNTEKVIAKRGSDGTHLWEESIITTSPDYGGIWAMPAGDLNGDGADDVIVQLYKSVSATDTHTEKVIAKRGSDGTHLWEESIITTSPDYGGIWAMPAGDLNGDGADDVIVQLYKSVSATGKNTEKVIAKRGSDGTHLWEESITTTSPDYGGIWAMPAGDLNGDGADDVIVQLYKSVSATGMNTQKVIAKKGSDGTHLWEESITTTSPGYGGIWAMPAGDLNGDGANDVIVQLYKSVSATSTNTEKVIAKKGSDGTHLWEESITTTSPDYGGIWAMPAGDLNGDGANDVIVQLYKSVSATSTNTEKVIAKKGSDGTHLWEESITTTSPDYGWIWAMPAGDLDGDGSNDVLAHQNKYESATGMNTETVIAKRGFDGNHIWEATSDEYIWTAMPYYPGPHYYYAESKIAVEPVPVPGRSPMSIYEPMEWEYGYDLNGDGIDDVVLGTSDTIYALTYFLGKKIDISTDKPSYTTGDKMYLGLKVKNPEEAQKVSVKIWLETPNGGTITLIDTYVTLPAGLNYNNPSFKVFTLPNIPDGTYVWHAVLDDLSGEILSEDTAKWDFAGTVVPIEDITEALPPCTTIDFGE